jgi:methyl-accepting chemotaxis protein
VLLASLYSAEKFLGLYQPVFVLDQKPVLNLCAWLGVLTIAAGAVGFFDFRLNRALQEVASKSMEVAARNQALENTTRASAAASKKVSQMAAHISSSSQKHAASLPQQVAAVQTVVASLRELDANSAQIAESTRGVLDATRETLELATEINATSEAASNASLEGSVATDKAVRSAEEARKHIALLLTELEGLTQQGKMLEEFSQTIRAIAKETRLLSLNAAIEAAGAGQFGARFKVVAGEVGKLARRSLETAAQVSAGLAAVQTAVSVAATLAAESDALSRSASERATVAGKTLTSLIGRVNQTVVQSSLILGASAAASSRCEEIATATVQQQSASQQILETMRGISAATDGQAKALQIVARIMQQLDGAAGTLDATLAEEVTSGVVTG